MVENLLTKEAIMNAGEDVLRRFGSEKANLSDVAKVLNVSHAAIYRYFKNKQSLWNAIAERWLDQISDPLNGVMNEPFDQAAGKMEQWLRCLAESKRKSAMDDPEMFHLYAMMAGQSGEVLDHHLDFLMEQLAEICQEGIRSGEFESKDGKQTSKAIFSAFSIFHNPVFSEQWSQPDYDDDFNELWKLIRDGLLKK